MARATLPIMLVVLGKSWGSVDWILPVLHSFHKLERARIIVYFRQDGVDEVAPRFSDLAAVLREVTSEVWSPSRLVRRLSLGAKLRLVLANRRLQSGGRGKIGIATWYLLLQLLTLPFTRSVFRASKLDETLLVALLHNQLSGGNVEWLLQDFDNNDYAAFYRRFPRARLFVFPHGTNWLAEQRFPPKTYFGMKLVPATAVWFTGRMEDEPIYRRLGLACDLAPCGHPKLDPAWIATMGARFGGKPTKHPLTPSLSILFLTMPMKKLSDRERFRELASAVFRVAVRRGASVLIKLHPSLPKREIHSVLRRHGHIIDIEWCTTSVLSASLQADVAVAFPSSAVMDAVAIGVPVLEFFDYRDQEYTSFVYEDGKPRSIYRQQGLVVPVDNEAELDALILRLQQAPDELVKIAERQRCVLERILGRREGALDRTIARILQAGTPVT